MAMVRELKSVVMTSERPEALAAFYREILFLPFEKEQHKGTEPHWACQFGAQHFAIHHPRGFWLPSVGQEPATATFLSFTIESLEPFVAHLERAGVEVLARTQIGPMQFVSFRDPDGRRVSCGTPWPEKRR